MQRAMLTWLVVGTHCCFGLFFCFKLIYLFGERQRQLEQGRGRERGRERIPGRLRPIKCRAQRGARTQEPWEHDLSRIQESDA